MDTAAEFLDLLGDIAIVIVWLVAVARLTRLLVTDRITDFLRAAAWKISKGNEDGMAWYLSTCPWCMSIWIGLATAPLMLWTIGVSMWWFPVFALVASWFAGVSAANFEGDSDDIEIEES